MAHYTTHYRFSGDGHRYYAFLLRGTEVIESIPEDSSGFPGMKIKDTKGREHHLTAVDFISYEWEKIKVGTRLLVNIEENITGAEIGDEDEAGDNLNLKDGVCLKDH